MHHSHSTVAGGLLLMSYATRFTLFTSDDFQHSRFTEERLIGGSRFQSTICENDCQITGLQSKGLAGRKRGIRRDAERNRCAFKASLHSS